MKMATLEKNIVIFFMRVIFFFVPPCFVLVRKQTDDEFINELTKKERRW